MLKFRLAILEKWLEIGQQPAVILHSEGHLYTQFVPRTFILILEVEYVECNTDAGTNIQHNPVFTCIKHTQRSIGKV